MKKTTLLYGLLIGAGSLFALQSFSSGATGNIDATGSPFSNNNCSQCHSDNNNFNSSTSLQVKDSNGNPVTEYVPGQTYEVSLVVSATSSAFGCQMVILDGNDANTGTLANPSSNAKITAWNGRNYMEHNARSTSNTFTADWTAPAAGTGTVTLYGTGNAVNANFNTSGDDPTVPTSITLTEGNTTSVRTVGEGVAILNIFPSPNNGTFSIQNNQSEAVEFVRLVTLTGIEVAQQQVYLPQGSTQEVRFDGLAPGVYNVVTEGKTLRQVRSILVQ